MRKVPNHKYQINEGLDILAQMRFHQIPRLVADPGVPPPPKGPNSFILADVFTEKCPHRTSAPPSQREILDPPLQTAHFCRNTQLATKVLRFADNSVGGRRLSTVLHTKLEH